MAVHYDIEDYVDIRTLITLAKKKIKILKLIESCKTDCVRAEIVLKIIDKTLLDIEI